MRFTTTVLAGGLLLTLTGCGVAAETAGQVGNAASTAAVCAQAVQIATKTPDLSDPKAAADRAHAAADELTGLASKAANTTAGEAIDKLATTLRETTADELVKTPAAWAQEKADQVAALTKACSGS
ncbi:bacteriophage spanin2 family protein [Amycolatopsis sp. A133]|uniref:bacteriophage spanin2 family protein n=1 Tax=Amycolatopsis sp. A133 TaxID=3064472 RepID=UPI0027F9A1E2|nr:bacteriophage spanin2 family protein [Amycolatopsis sp. A133]MDQ7803011.1 bacteriophage spanin2 family protein [Amycolatopsis sp. A133]